MRFEAGLHRRFPRHNGQHRTYKDDAMGQAAQKTVFTATDYLTWEAEQVDRHEFLDGEVFAMAGAEDRM